MGSGPGADSEEALPGGGGEVPVVEVGGAPGELFDDALIHEIVITLDPEDWEYLQRNPADEEYETASVALGDARLDEVGLRFKGSWGSLFWCADGTLDCDKLNLKLDFHEYVDAQRFYGLKQVNLHAMEVDDSQMREHLAYRTWRAAGVPASRTGWARVRVNGDDLGLYLLVEQVDGRFTKDRWGGDGNLYKEVWITEEQGSTWKNALETNRSTGEPDRMLAFGAALAEADQDDFVAVLDEHSSSEALVRFLAAMDLTGSFDSIAAFYCSWSSCGNHNYFWYEGDEDIVLLPWDMDRHYAVPVWLFGDDHDVPLWHEPVEDCTPMETFYGIEVMPPGCDPLLGLAGLTLKDRYDEVVVELREGPADLDALNAEIDRLTELLAEEVASDALGPTVQEWEAGITDLREDLVVLDGGR